MRTLAKPFLQRKGLCAHKSPVESQWSYQAEYPYDPSEGMNTLPSPKRPANQSYRCSDYRWFPAGVADETLPGEGAGTRRPPAHGRLHPLGIRCPDRRANLTAMQSQGPSGGQTPPSFTVIQGLLSLLIGTRRVQPLITARCCARSAAGREVAPMRPADALPTSTRRTTRPASHHSPRASPELVGRRSSAWMARAAHCWRTRGRARPRSGHCMRTVVLMSWTW
jgi:hypothetical protein